MDELYNKIRQAILEDREQIDEVSQERAMKVWKYSKNPKSKELAYKKASGHPDVIPATQNEDSVNESELGDVLGSEEGVHKTPKTHKDEYGNVIKNYPKHMAKKAMKDITKEEVELDEEKKKVVITLSPENAKKITHTVRDGLGRPLDKDGNVMKESHTVKYAMKNPSMGGKIAVAHYDSKEDAEKFLQSIKKKGGNGIISTVKESVLDEARGRPPKEGSEAWKRQQANKGDDIKALEVQLRKTVSIGSPVTFHDGNTHEVTSGHAQRFMDHMAARRTSQEKADFQKRASKSHEAFKSAVSEPVPGQKKDTGEIVKYR